jgi:hypothetical protein
MENINKTLDKFLNNKTSMEISKDDELNSNSTVIKKTFRIFFLRFLGGSVLFHSDFFHSRHS